VGGGWLVFGWSLWNCGGQGETKTVFGLTGISIWVLLVLGEGRSVWKSEGIGTSPALDLMVDLKYCVGGTGSHAFRYRLDYEFSLSF
jgi:hypothetical protein